MADAASKFALGPLGVSRGERPHSAHARPAMPVSGRLC
jgi:hypothetical protein